jgi:L-fucose isomerase-like protein
MGSFEHGFDLWKKGEVAGIKNRQIQANGCFHWLKAALQTKCFVMACLPDAKSTCFPKILAVSFPLVQTIHTVF